MSSCERGGMPQVFLLDGPSGSGKSTLVSALLERFGDRLCFCRRVTTRAPRPGERPGSDYDFVDERRFQELVEAGELAAFRRFQFGMSYGLPRTPVDRALARGQDVLALIDLGTVAAARQIWPDCVSFFLVTPLEDLEIRLQARGGHTQAQISERLENARKALELVPYYDYVVSNRQGNLDRTVERLARILEGEICTAGRS